MNATGWANVALTAMLTIVGLWLANSLSRKTRAERLLSAVNARFEIYPKLWAAAMAAAPMEEVVGGRPLTAQDRDDLYKTLTAWFWDDAGGMVLGEPSRTIYLRAKENLRVPADKIWPPSAAATILGDPDPETARSRLSRRQLSLLRTAMRADLGILGRPYGRPLSAEDKDFLRRAGARLWQAPWWDGSVRSWATERLLRRRRTRP